MEEKIISKMTNLFHFGKSKPQKFAGGDLRRASERSFPPLKEIAIQSLHMKVGAIREPHSHPNAHQLDYCISGHALVGIIGPDGHKQFLELEAGDISFVPQGYIHWIENKGREELKFLVMLTHNEPETIELSETLIGVPNKTLEKVLGISEKIWEKLPEKAVVVAD